MSNTFKNRVFGCVVIKSVNSNYNADFSGSFLFPPYATSRTPR